MIQDVILHFQKNDPVLYNLAKKYPLEELKPHENLFEALCDEIISQQLSGKAASTIFSRVKGLFIKEINPDELLQLPEDLIRKAGCSWAKIRSLKDLAQKVQSKTLDLQSLKNLKSEEILKKLTSVKGIGPWTAEMFMMFSLGHTDIFSHGDLGLKKAIKNLYHLEEPTKEDVEKITKKWSPYKTYACKILWSSLNNQ